MKFYWCRLFYCVSEEVLVVDCCHDRGVLWCDWDGGIWLAGVMSCVSLQQVDCFHNQGGVVILFLCWVKCFHFFGRLRRHDIRP